MDRISNRQRIGDFSALRGLKWNMSQTKYGAKIDNIITFDIETSTGYIRNNKYVADYGIYNKIRDEWIKTYDGSADVKTAAIMYIWQAAIDVGDDIYTFYGRTWDEYKTFVAEVSEAAKRYHFYGRPNGGEIPKGQGQKK